VYAYGQGPLQCSCPISGLLVLCPLCEAFMARKGRLMQARCARR
jgi:hypothetical protein